jgi:hypothetical protein
MSAAQPQTVGMHNTKGEFVDLYIPRKWYGPIPCSHPCPPISLHLCPRFSFCSLMCQILCSIFFHELCASSECFLFSSATGRLISSTDHGSVVINVGQGIIHFLTTVGFHIYAFHAFRIFLPLNLHYKLFFTFESAIVRF